MKINEKTKKILGISAVAGGAALAASLSAYITTKCLVNAALDREPPQILKNASRIISGTRSGDDFSRCVAEASERLAVAENEVVTIKSHDGTNLTAHLIPAPDAERLITAGAPRGTATSAWCLISGTTTAARCYTSSSADRTTAAAIIWASGLPKDTTALTG